MSSIMINGIDSIQKAVNTLEIKKYEGIFQCLPGVDVQIVTLFNSQSNIIRLIGIWLDMSAITKEGTFDLLSKIDGVNYRSVGPWNFLSEKDPDGLYVGLNGMVIDTGIKLIYTSKVDEESIKDIPYKIFYEDHN